MGWAAVLVTLDGRVSGQFAGDVLLASVEDPIAFGDLLVDAASRSGADHVVVAVPALMSEATAAAITLTAVRAPTLRIAQLVSWHTPMTLHAGLTVAKTSVPEPAVAHGYLAAFAACSWSGGWMPSVTALAVPAPSLSQHLRSLAPGGEFVVSFAPTARIGRGASALPRGEVSGLRRTLLVSDGAALRPALTQSMATETGAATVRPYPLQGDWGQVLGHRKAVQLALVPTDPMAVPMGVVTTCTSCRERLATAVCPFCHVRALVGSADSATSARI